ncbi:sensor histidine kinase [Streptomyces cyaneofuscatus]|uniref:sensor histidine kinase n=1 Tax=Streptomyces cyaneofuscatus TaxID=66883 RepID=UPI0034264E9C
MDPLPERRHFIDRLAPGWLVVQFLGTGMLVVALATAVEDTLWIWGFYAASIACWILFIALHPWYPKAAAALLAFSALLPAVVVGAADDTTAVIMLCVLLGRYTSLIAPSGQLITGVTLSCLVCTWISSTLADRPLSDVLGYPLLILVLTLLGLNRRQEQLRTEQAEQMLGHVLLAQQEKARAAALAERTRIAREMHDVLAHSLGALSVQLKVAAALIEKGDSEAALARVLKSNRLADEGLAEARNAVAALRGDIPSLPDALKNLVEQHRANHAVDVGLRLTGEPRRLSPAAAVCLVQTVREALSNAAKHAPGEPIEITLGYGDGSVCLLVDNATRSLSHAGSDHVPGYGLTGIRERLALVGGMLTAERADCGTRWALAAEVPE